MKLIKHIKNFLFTKPMAMHRNRLNSKGYEKLADVFSSIGLIGLGNLVVDIFSKVPKLWNLSNKNDFIILSGVLIGILLCFIISVYYNNTAGKIEKANNQ